MDYVQGFVVSALLIGLLIIGRLVFAFVSQIEGYSLTKETVENDNPAVGIRYALFLFAIILGFSQIINTSESFASEVGFLFKYGGIVIGVVLASRFLTDFLILSGFNNNKEVIGEKNVAVALVEGSTYVATGFIVATTLVGLEDKVVESLVWLLIGEALLVLLALAYRQVISHMFEALDQANIACALSLGGLLVSTGLAISIAVSGESHGWGSDARNVASFMAGWLAFMVIADLVVDRIILPAHRLRNEIMEQRNVAAGVIEGTIFVAVTLLYTFVVR